MVEKTAEDYSKLLQSISLDKEINPICVSIEDMLTRLDELESLLVNVKGETNVIMEQYTSSILAFTPQFEILQQRINQLEHFIEVVNNNVDEVEKSIDIAEAELNVTDYSLKGLLFKPLLAKAKSVSDSNSTTSSMEEPVASTNLKDGNFQSVPIFNTLEYFKGDVIIATVVALTRAAPMSELLHPSPVNPDVLVDIKPQEKIILMTDPIEIAKFKRETKQPLYPTVTPPEINHHRSKREHERPNQQQKPRDPLPLQKPQPPKKPSTNQRNRREVEPVKVTQTLPAANGSPIVVEIYQKPLVLPATTEASVTQTSTTNSQKSNENDTKEDKVEEVTTEKSTRVQGLPAIFSPSKKQKRDVNNHQNIAEAPKEKQTHECKPEEFSQLSESKTHQQHKRDIPVPLVPKHHHSEESPKESNEKVDSQQESLEVPHDIHHRQENDSPADFQKPQILPAIIEEPTTETQQHKRDIPVPLVPKHHHPEESPKESNEKNSHEDSHRVQEEHIAPADFQKPQLLPAVLNKSPEEVQEHKRDIPVPLVPKHHHPEESPKESNEKESENHHDSNAHSRYEEFQKPQVLPAIFHESPVETQHKRDIPVPLVPKHHHSEESLKDGNVKETSEDMKNTESGSHHDLHHIQEEFQKPHVLPAILTETSADTQHKRDVSIPMIAEQHQPEQSLKQHNEMELHDEKNSENHHKFPQLPQTLSAQMQGEHLQADADHKDKNEKVTEIQHTPQTLPAHIPHYQHHQHIFPQQQTNPENHVVSIPIIHKFQPKAHSDYHHLNAENQNLPQSLMAQNNQHLTAEHNHNLQVHNQEQVAVTNLQAPHIPLNPQNSQVHNSENMAATNLQNTQVVSNHNQEHVEHSGFPKPLTLPTINQHHDVLQKPQPQPTLPMIHQHQDGIQKPEIQPVVNSQIKRDISTNSESVQQSDEHKRGEDEHKNQDHHPKPDEVQVEDLSETKPLHQSNLHHVQLTHSNYHQHIPNHPNPDEVQVEDLTEPKPLHQQHHHHVHSTHSKQQQNIPNVPNPDEVQVEDLSESKPLHQAQVHHMQLTNSEHKPNILDDHLSAYNVQSSTTTEHPIIRHRPVPVAELFSRPHDN
ncbi:hypothetical protein DOY81_000713 [Sarcophaga bullata]|nr:hypothetical protein DOY81_000713 [Sarcophaga bullata]